MRSRIDPFTTAMRLLAVPLCFLPAIAAFAADASQEVYELSPFTVETSDADIGYYATSTLSGTRMNSKLKDLGASITVVTAQQLEDTASVDLNDVFLYEANTEGTHTYTEFGMDRGMITTSSVQQSPQTANRIRGIGRADRSVDYFISLDSIPVDSYNVDRLTINRGPNSVLFGLGSAAGLVNTSPSQAIIGTDLNNVGLRVGSEGEFRGSFNVNRTVIEDKLALRVAALYHDRGFSRKPSHDTTRRQYVSATFRPFDKTTFRAAYERYANDYRRPNPNTPQDFISTWRAAGSPTFNPSTMMIRQGNGTLVPIGTASTNAFDAQLNAFSNNGLSIHPHNTRAAFLVEDNQIYTRIQRQLGSSIGGTQLVEQVVATRGPNLPSAIFTTPGIQNKDIYDWEKINVLSGNYGEDEAQTYQFMLEQQVTDDLFIELGVRKESFERFGLSAQSGSQAGIYVDVNETLLDGSPNPFFLKPYIEVWEPTGNTNVTNNQAMRATVAYQLDFSDNDGWTRWLGRHNLMGLGEQRDIDERGYRWREAVISTHEGWAPERTNAGNAINKSTGSNFRTRQNRVYYLGENGRITKSPGDALFSPLPRAGEDYPTGVIGQPVPQNLRHFIPEMIPVLDGDGNVQFDANGNLVTTWAGRDGDTNYGVPGGRPRGEWVNEGATMATILHDVNPATELTDIRSVSAAAQSYLWDGRIVTTFGWRKDTQKTNRSAGPFINDLGFRDDVPGSLNRFPNPWTEVEGQTRTKGVVIHPLANRNVPDFLEGLSFHYNESATTRPVPEAQDLFSNPVPNPSGEGKDYGIGFSLLENKLVARVNWYEAAEANSRQGGASLVMWRSRRVEFEGSWGFVQKIEEDIELREGLPINSLNAQSRDDPTTAPYLNEILTRSGLQQDLVQFTGPGHADTRTLSSEGMEISLDYNPTRNWNFKFTAGRQESVNSEVNPATQRWIFGGAGFSYESPAPGSRLDVWRGQSPMFYDRRDFPAGWQDGDPIPAGVTRKPWWTTNWAGMPSWGTTPQGWYEGVVESLLRSDTAQQGQSNPQVREWRWSFITNYRFNEGPLQGVGLGGSVRWEDKAAIGYEGAINPASGVLNLFDTDSPIYDKARDYYDFWASYSTRVMDDRVRMKLQLNVRNAFEGQGLQVFAANPDGSGAGFRIRDGRTWYLTSTFDF